VTPSSRSMARSVRYLLLLSMALFALSLAQDGFTIEGPNPRAWSSGGGVLLVGWLGLLYDGVWAWLANPMVMLSWALLKLRRSMSALVCAIAACVLALTFLRVRFITVSEAPTTAPIATLESGYWIWIASMCVAALAALAGHFGGRAESRSVGP
jgi:hypothetical protein